VLLEMIQDKYDLYDDSVQSVNTFIQSQPIAFVDRSKWMDVIETIVGAHIRSVAAVLFERNEVTKPKKWVLDGYSTFVENTLSDHWMIPNVRHNIYLQEQLYNCTGNNDLSFVELIQTIAHDPRQSPN
jgi:hypothetical protein